MKILSFQQRSIFTMVFAVFTMVFAILTMVSVFSTMVFMVLTAVFVPFTMVFVVPTMAFVFSTLVFEVEKTLLSLDHLFSEEDLRPVFLHLGKSSFKYPMSNAETILRNSAFFVRYSIFLTLIRRIHA